MKDYISERVVAVGKYIIDSGETIRNTAKHFHVSKSTIHKDVTKILPKVNPELAKEVRKVLEINYKQKHIRGGMATRKKYVLRKRNLEEIIRKRNEEIK